MTTIIILILIYLASRKKMTPSDVQKLVDHTKQWEGGLSRTMKDTASKLFCPTPHTDGHKYHTNKGVTYTTWKSLFGSDKDNRFLNMSNSDWLTCYKHFQKKVNADKVKSWQIGATITQFAWGSGIYGGSKLVQQILNSTGSNLSVDGKIGVKTLAEINKRNPRQLFDQLIEGREMFFKKLAVQNPDKYAWALNGWLNRLNDFKNTFRP